MSGAYKRPCPGTSTRCTPGDVRGFAWPNHTPGVYTGNGTLIDETRHILVVRQVWTNPDICYFILPEMVIRIEPYFGRVFSTNEQFCVSFGHVWMSSAWCILCLQVFGGSTMTCLEACDSDVIQMCTRHEATTNDFCFRHLKFTRRCYTTSLGHRANSSVFPVAPLAMMQVDMAIPDEEREDVLNTTSFELLEMTQEQTEVGSRWLKGLVTSRPTTVLPYCAMFCSGYRLEDVFMYFVFGYTHDFCHLSIFIPFVSNMSCIFVDNGQVGMAQNDHFLGALVPHKLQVTQEGWQMFLDCYEIHGRCWRGPPWCHHWCGPHLDDSLHNAQGGLCYEVSGRTPIRSLTAWLSQTMWRTWCLGFIILILILIINIILHYPPTPCQRLGAWGLLPGWFLRLTCLTFLKRCQLLRRVPMQPQAQRPDVRLIGAQKAKIIRILG